MTPVRLKPAAPQSRVKYSTTEILPSHIIGFKWFFMYQRLSGPKGNVKTEGEGRGFQNLQGDLTKVNALKNMFDHYYCVSSTIYLPN